MTDVQPGGPRDNGTRDNGLRAGNYVPIGDLDPRVVDDVLLSLRERGIAAYAVPAQNVTSHSLESRVPDRPMDRLFVDDQRLDDARQVVDAETADAVAEGDFESSWQQVLASLQSSPTHMQSPWPERENLTLAERETAYDEEQRAREPEDEHYVPPPPPPLPKLRPSTWAALMTMGLCIVVMVTDIGGRGMDVLAFIVFVAAAASLVYNMRQGPPDDGDGWDDGAVV